MQMDHRSQREVKRANKKMIDTDQMFFMCLFSYTDVIQIDVLGADKCKHILLLCYITNYKIYFDGRFFVITIYIVWYVNKIFTT